MSIIIAEKRNVLIPTTYLSCHHEKEESSKKRAILKSKGITYEAQLTALQTECNECNELRKEIHRLKNENESLYSKLAEKDLEI